MGLHLLMSRLYNGGERTTRYFSRISTSSDEWSTNNLYPPFPEKNPLVAGSCNGLLCLHNQDGKYVVWNPSTDTFQLIPPPDLKPPPCDCTFSVHKKFRDRCIMSSVKSFVRGFGFDAESQDYKFVRFIITFYEADYEYGRHSAPQQVAVYSFKNNSWNEIPYPGQYNFSGGSATYVNGFCYWKGCNVIVSFDLANENFSTFPYPDIAKEGGDMLDEYHVLLIEFDGSLGVVIHPGVGITKLFSFWVYQGASWTRKINLDVRLVGAENPLWFGKNDRNGESLLLQGIDGTLLEYDYTVRELKKIDEIYDYPHTMEVFPYVETNENITTVREGIQRYKRLCENSALQECSSAEGSRMAVMVWLADFKHKRSLKDHINGFEESEVEQDED